MRAAIMLASMKQLSRVVTHTNMVELFVAEVGGELNTAQPTQPLLLPARLTSVEWLSV